MPIQLHSSLGPSNRTYDSKFTFFSKLLFFCINEMFELNYLITSVPISSVLRPGFRKSPFIAFQMYMMVYPSHLPDVYDGVSLPSSLQAEDGEVF